MRNIRKIFPVILMVWPYLFIPCIILTDKLGEVFGIALTVYTVITVIVYGLNIWNACGSRNETAPRSMAFYDMLVKLVHIPFYIGVFLVGLILLFSMVVPALLFISPIMIVCLAIIDYFLMLTSSAYGISAAVRLSKRNLLSKKAAALYIVLHLFFVLDVISAVFLYCTSRKKISS